MCESFQCCVVCAFLNELVGWRWWALSYGIIALVVFPGCDYSAIIITRDFSHISGKEQSGFVVIRCCAFVFYWSFKIWMAPELPVISLIESTIQRQTNATHQFHREWAGKSIIKIIKSIRIRYGHADEHGRRKSHSVHSCEKMEFE